MTDDEFLQAFEGCLLTQQEWTHRAHIRMAWLYLRRGTLDEMLPVVRTGIQRYNAAHGKAPAYHETITQAFAILIDDRMRSGREVTSFNAFCERNPDLLDRELAALLKHYQRETLFSRAAREAFVAPDVAPLPGRSTARI